MLAHELMKFQTALFKSSVENNWLAYSTQIAMKEKKFKVVRLLTRLTRLTRAQSRRADG